MAKTSSLNDKLVVLIGGTGFLGTHVAQSLLARGARLRIACRHPERAFKLKPLANLGQIQFVSCDVKKPGSLEAALMDADAAVYLVGAFNGALDALQAEGPGLAAGAAKSAGAEAFVLVSAIGADAGSEVAYAATKAEGERRVFEAFPDATVIRPSVLFGEDDKFINLFANLIAAFPALPIFGPTARMQPLEVGDAAEAIANALADPAKHGGRTYEIAGPEVLTMSEINHRIAAAQHRKRAFAELPDAVSGFIASATGWLPGAAITADQWKLLKAGNVASGTRPGLAELGITPRPLGLFLDRWMTRFRKHGRFGAKTETAKR